MKIAPTIRIKLANLSLTLIIIAICVCFKTPLAEFLNLLLVKPFISKFDNTYPSTAFMLVMLVALDIWMWTSLSKKFSSNIGVVVLLFYLTQRSNAFWRYQNFLLFPKLYLWDIVVIALLIPTLKHLIRELKSDSEVGVIGGFIEEEPVIDKVRDDFQRSMVANNVAEMVLATKNKRSLAIGIVGTYGSGKTSFMHLITNHFSKEAVEVIWFNPWSAEKAEYIGRDFFDLLAHHLYYVNPKFNSLITTYSRKLSRVYTVGEKLLRQLTLLSNFQREYRSEYDRINELLRESRKKIVVVIDDIDRLYNDEVIEVLRLIRNTANFTNMVYLVAYERQYIVGAIRSINAKVTDNYLDKIIQVEITLPKRETDDLLRLLNRLLRPLVSEEDYQSMEKDIIPHGFKINFELSIQDVFRNSRDVIRFVNSFQLNYQMLKTETMFENLFMLELLKYRFIDVYDLLYERRPEWLMLKTKRSQHEEYYELKEDKKDNKQHLVIEKELSDYNERDRELIIALLKNIFNDYNRHRNAKHAIIYPMFFERYFRFRIAKNEISEHEFRKSWDAGLTAIKKFIDKAIAKQLTNPTLNRFFQIEPKSKADFEQLIESIFYFAPKYVQEYGRTSFDSDALIDKLWNFEDVIAMNFYSGNVNAYAAFLKGQFASASLPYLFENEIIYRIKETSREIPISKDELVKQQIEYFRRHVAEEGLTDAAMWLLFGIRQSYTEPAPEGKVYNKWRFEPDVVPFAKKTIVENDPTYFLRYSIYFDVRDKEMVAIEPHILEFFDDPQDLRTLVAHHPLIDENTRADYLLFFDKCIAAGMSKLVKHTFVLSLAREGQAVN